MDRFGDVSRTDGYPTHLVVSIPTSCKPSLARSARQLGLPVESGAEDPKRVGHFSVRADYLKLAKVPLAMSLASCSS